RSGSPTLDRDPHPKSRFLRSCPATASAPPHDLEDSPSRHEGRAKPARELFPLRPHFARSRNPSRLPIRVQSELREPQNLANPVADPREPGSGGVSHGSQTLPGIGEGPSRGIASSDPVL